MSRPHNIKGQPSQYKVRPLDEDLFYQLFDILHDGCFEGNWSATARALGISQRTVRSWSKTPPKGFWWTNILTQIITEIYHSMTHSAHKKVRKRAEKVAGQLHRAGLHSLKEYLGYNAERNSGVQRELLVFMIEHGPTSLTDLRKPANLGGYSERAIREAATQIGLIREAEGFGKEKGVVYRMPTEDDIK